MDYTMYSEDEYYDRMQLMNIYQPTACNCIWEEIVAYRKLFQYDFQFTHKRQFITLNKTLFHKMMRVYDCNVNGDFENISMLHFCEAYGNNKKQCFLYYLQLQNITVTEQMIHFLFDEQLFLLRLFYVHTYFKDKNITDLYLYLNQKEVWSATVHKIDVQIESITTQNDVTKYFRNFLDSFYFNSQDNVVKLKSTILNNLDEVELLTRYPMCNRKQITFYLNHCQLLHYYTIAQYSHYHNVSYETSRKAMEQLVELGFYKKVKIGKKFVFTSVE